MGYCQESSPSGSGEGLMSHSLLYVDSTELILNKDNHPSRIQISSFSINPGQRFLLTGPSGSGKSTLMAFLAGVPLQHVQIFTQGKNKLAIAGHPSFTWISQNPWSQLVAPTVEKELAFALENHALDPSIIRFKVNQALQEYHLTSLALRKPWTLSNGECQLVAIACALLQNPDLIFLDEPFSCLDSCYIKRLLSIFDRMSDRTSLLAIDHQPWLWQGRVDKVFELVQETPNAWKLHPRKITEAPPVLRRRNRSTYISKKPILKLQGLTGGYQKGNPVLKDLDLELYSGTITVIEGPSGCGKTTLLKCLTGRLKPWSGRFLPKKPRKILVWVPQNPEHFFLYNTTEQEWRGAEDQAQAYGLCHLAQRSPYTLSEGEKRRLNLVAALALKRPILLLDEPNFGLDGPSLKALIHDLNQLKSAGSAILIISHNQELCQTLADQRLLLHHGRLELADS